MLHLIYQTLLEIALGLFEMNVTQRQRKERQVGKMFKGGGSTGEEET